MKKNETIKYDSIAQIIAFLNATIKQIKDLFLILKNLKCVCVFFFSSVIFAINIFVTYP